MQNAGLFLLAQYFFNKRNTQWEQKIITLDDHVVGLVIIKITKLFTYKMYTIVMRM